MKIAIVGGGGLTQAFVDNYPEYQCTVFERQQYDITDRRQCDLLIEQLVDFDSVIISAGLMNNDSWNIWLVNTVAPCYILEQLIKKGYQNRVVMVSSNAGNWTSWPEINFARLVYNNSKHAISHLISGVDQGELFKNCVVVEPSRFCSRMSHYQGEDAKVIAEAVNLALTNKLGLKTVVIAKKIM